MLSFVYGSSKRIFLNTTIGCNSNCKYCYLHSMQGNTTKLYRQAADEVYNSLEALSFFERGKDGTILSIGCYSECMDAENVQQTEILLRKLILLGNRIQLATKRKIPVGVLKEISRLRKDPMQITIYVSLPTISYIKEIEPGTACFADRMFNIEMCRMYDIPAVLYIKPFLKGITACDVDKYIDIVQKYDISAVVGDYLSAERKENLIADVGEGKLFESIQENGDMQYFINRLREYTCVYRHSVDVYGR